MKFRTLSRLIYLKTARHRRGHGIHSPYLFRLITTVIEDRRRLPEYKIFKELNYNALLLLDHFSVSSFTNVYQYFNLATSKTRKLYKKVELPLRYMKVVFRLISDFKPSGLINYGPALGVNLAAMAMANNYSTVYQIVDDPEYTLFTAELLKDSAINNIYFLSENSIPPIHPEFIMINYPNNPDQSRNIVQRCLSRHEDNDLLIIRGIHESKEMETIWQEMIGSNCVRVSLDLFEIGIVLFRKGLQKENFILKF